MNVALVKTLTATSSSTTTDASTRLVVMSEDHWERVLWKQQSFPDNYVPPSFLSSLTKNPNFRPYTYWPLMLGACAITQHLSTIFIFLSVFVRLLDCTFDPRLLVFISAAMFVAGYALWELLECTQGGWLASSDRRAKAVKASILVFLALMALAPVLRTLTAATSSDSIWALSACLLILNAALADYSSAARGVGARERLTSVLSINAAISAAVVLASRLQDDLSVFALVLFAVQLFALFPLLRYRLQDAPSSIQLGSTLTLAAFSVVIAAPLSATVASLFATALGSTTFLAPAVLLWAQQYKNEIRGPWDAATPRVHS
ncbi:phosphatidylinositol N-acetylglucosaminyltransferase [Auriscalpium vulgare]|uniref:Phosphatidylinositol N-acetylglucosaminyltransferase n=1 Tax=Auriscalpium vulgare TaxID=40419 RepID=A0ACB8S566_9AGAM|nr:phosphatidylinositol N-acetylglucosaminyltransferase [Auriscalpium vulgare]